MSRDGSDSPSHLWLTLGEGRVVRVAITYDPPPSGEMGSGVFADPSTFPTGSEGSSRSRLASRSARFCSVREVVVSGAPP